MTKITVGERMTRIETTLEYIKEASDDNKVEHQEIIKLFTDALEKKADKDDLNKLSKITYTAIGGLATIFIGALSFLIKYTLFG